jgi:hypothetical protein
MFRASLVWLVVAGVASIPDPAHTFPIDSTYRFEPVPGKILGFWPDVWTVERLTQLRTRYGFNYAVVPATRSAYNAALQAGFAPSTIVVTSLTYGNESAAVDSFEAGIYYIDEAVEHNCVGQPSAGPIYSPQQLAAVRDYIHAHRPGAKFISSGYKRCSHFSILVSYVDLIMYSSYVNWYELNVFACIIGLGWGDILEKPWLEGPDDQTGSWQSMKSRYGSKFTMTWIRGRNDDYSILLPLANNLGLQGLWLFHNEPIDTTLLLNFCNAAWQNGWMMRIAEPLPVQLSSFTAARNSLGVRLNWRTLTETNNFGFYVERRISTEQNFTQLPNSFIPGHGTTIVPHDYTYTDSSATSENLFYRFRQIDLDNTVHFSEVVAVGRSTSVEEEFPLTIELFQNFPNPFNPSTRIRFTVPASVGTRHVVSLRVYDLLGREVRTLVNEKLQAGSHEVTFNAGGLASGTYSCRLQAGDLVQTKKLLLLR